MQAIDAGEQVGGALDERDERGHRDRNAALGKIATHAIKRVRSENF